MASRAICQALDWATSRCGFREQHNQCGDRVSGRPLGDPTVVPVRESSIEVGLELRRAARHIPRSIFGLRGEQIAGSFSIRCISARDGRFFQRIQRRGGRIGVGFQIGCLRPATVLALQPKNVLARPVNRRASDTGPLLPRRAVALPSSPWSLARLSSASGRPSQCALPFQP